MRVKSAERLRCGRNRGGFAPRIELAFGDSASLRGIRGAVKRAAGTAASADATKKNAPQRKVGPRRRVGGASAGERRDAGSRDAPADASETRRRYPADEVSRCGRWMQRAGGVELFPGGRDEHASPWPSSRGCHARPRSGSGNRRNREAIEGLRRSRSGKPTETRLWHKAAVS